MFQDMSKKLNDSMGSMKELVDIQTRLLEDLTRLQMECAKNCVEVTLEQTKQLPTCATPEAVLKLQRHYAKALEDALLDANSKNLETFKHAREEMERITGDAFSAFAPKK
jgi:hypothetical protein